MPSCTARRGRRDPNPAPSHAAQHGGCNHADERQRVHRHGGDEDQCLGECRQRMSDVKRARYQLVRNAAKELEDRGCRRKSADPEGVKEVGRESRAPRPRRARCGPPVGCGAARSRTTSRRTSRQ